MAVVGTAYVKIRALTASLERDIENAVNKAVAKSEPAIKAAGERIGQNLGDNIGPGLQDAVEREAQKITPTLIDNVDVDGARGLGVDLGDGIGQGTEEGVERRRVSLWKRLRHVIGDGLHAGPLQQRVGDGVQKIGANLISGISKFSLGPATWIGIIGIPALIGVAKIATAYLSSVVSLVGAIGPAIAGGAVVAGNALFSLAGGAGALFLAFKSGAPEVARFKTVMSNLGKDWTKLGRTIAKDTIPLLGQAITTLSDGLLPVLAPGLRASGREIGKFTVATAKMLTSPFYSSRIGNIMDTNAKMLGGFGRGLKGITGAAVVLMNAARPLALQFSNWIGRLGELANKSAVAGEKTGRLAAFFERAGKVSSQLGRIFHNVAAGLYGVFKAASPSGQTYLDGIEKLSKRFSDFTKSLSGKNKLRKFFDDVVPVVQAANRLIGAVILALFGGLAEGDNSSLVTVLDSLRTDALPAVESLVDALGSLGPGFVGLIASFSDLLKTLADSGALGAFTATLNTMLIVLNKLAQTPFLGTMLAMSLGALGVYKAFNFVTGGLLGKALGALWTKFSLGTKLVGYLSKAGRLLFTALKLVGTGIMMVGRAMLALVVSNPIVAVIALIIGALVLLYFKFKPFRELVNSIARAVAGFFVTAWGVMKQVFAWIVANVFPIIARVVGVFMTVGRAIMGGIVTYLRILFGVWKAIFTALLIPVRIVVGLVILYFQTMWKVWRAILTTVFNFVRSVFNRIIGAVRGPVITIWNVIKKVWTGIKNAIVTAVNTVWPIIQNVFGKVSSFIGGVFSGIKDVVTGVWDFIKTGLEGIGDIAKSAVNLAIGGINIVIRALNKVVGIANKLPGPDLPTLDEIPKLAKGGTVYPSAGGTVVRVAEAGRPERIEPLDANGLSARDRAIIAALSGGGRSPINLTVKLGDQEISELVSAEVDGVQTNTARQIQNGVIV